jgi:hypothetical protein
MVRGLSPFLFAIVSSKGSIVRRMLAVIGVVDQDEREAVL